MDINESVVGCLEIYQNITNPYLLAYIKHRFLMHSSYCLVHTAVYQDDAGKYLLVPIRRMSTAIDLARMLRII